MTSTPLAALSTCVALASFAGCSAFHQHRAVVIKSSTGNVTNRWTATLVTPANLTGAVQMQGSAWMAPAADNKRTSVSVNISNASPGGVHPWQVRQGQCGTDQGALGAPNAYPILTVANDGRASATATLPLMLPTTGSYFVAVYAAPSNMNTVVACGNLAPPVQ